MPRKSAEAITEVETHVDAPVSIESKLDEILAFMHRAERRDRWRTAGGFIRGMLGIIPLAVLLGSLWYFYTNGEELMSELMDQTIQRSTEYSQESLMDQLEGYMQR